MSKRTDYWKLVADTLMEVSRKAPTNADGSLTVSMAYRALALSQCADEGSSFIEHLAQESPRGGFAEDRQPGGSDWRRGVPGHPDNEMGM